MHQQLDDHELNQRICEVMKEVDLEPETRHRYPNEFSGGKGNVLKLLLVPILKPEFILLDEPTSSLDRTVRFKYWIC